MSKAAALMIDTHKLTPLFVQYFSLKEANPGCVMLMRVGDFYEAYGEDADLLARDAEIVLTSKEAGGGQRISMSGVPYFAVDQYLRTMVEKGHRVAIAEQMEDARQAKGLVRRDVIRVVTAGTILDPQLLDEKQHNFLMCLAVTGEEVGLAAADVSTGEFLCTELPLELEKVADEALRFRPAELILAGQTDKLPGLRDLPRVLEASPVDEAESLTARKAEEVVRNQFRLASLQACDLEGRKAAVLAAASLLRYLQQTQRTSEITLAPPLGYSVADHMVIDNTSRRNLELTETLLGRERKGSLLWVTDQTCTSMGARRLRQWLLRPLLSTSAISERLQAVESLATDYHRCQELRRLLAPILDIERLLARVVYKTANARDLAGLQQSLAGLPEVENLVEELGDPTLARAGRNLTTLQDTADLLAQALASDPPVSLREGGLIADSYNPDLDELRGLRTSGKEWIASLQERERQETGIKSLKVGFNQVFGYYLEVTKANLKSVPETYIRKQTLANSERYFTPELKEYEAKVLGAEDRIRELEYDLFCELRDQVAARAAQLREVAGAIAELDVLSGFAEAAIRYDWVRPEVVDENVLEIEGGRHPVVERSLDLGFVPNDCELNEKDRLVVLTGPNMSGKSTYLRQNALIVVMAQMGCFVPARRALIGVTDRVFTRVGASDDLHLGQSTFMVEMSEAANILLHATPRSLVILDEIGRGTSTFDGLALARAIAEYLYETVQAKTLFATHFHELTNLARRFPGVRNCRVAVRENRDDIVFLHRIVPGGADRSYGIYVAQLAGVPGSVLERARVLLKDLEKGTRREASHTLDSLQLSLFTPTDQPDWTRELRNLDLESLSPEQALEKLYLWKTHLLSGSHDQTPEFSRR